MSRHAANNRGDYWNFTWESWIDMWTGSGVMEHYGRKIHQYCMARKDPIEAWGPDNCIIIKRRTLIMKHAHENFNGVERTEFTDKHDIRNKQ